MKNLYCYLLSLLVLTSCANVDKMIDKGQYDQAIDKLVHRLAGKKNKKKDEVIALEYAFKKAQDRDLRTEKTLRDENIPENWTRVYTIHNQITSRQNKIEGLLPLETNDGYQATFNFVNIDELKKESKRNTADFYYQSALSLIDESRRSGDKNAAREAYNYLNKIDGLFSQYKEKEQLKKDALNLSMENYLVKINNQTNQIIPADVEAELLKWSVDGLNSKFKNFDVKANPALNYDHYILLNLTQMEFSPEREKTRIYDDVNEITTEEVVKDRNGKPRRDTLGKEIKEKVVTRYVATIEEISQLKSVLVGGRLEFINVRSTDIEFTKSLQVEGVFENKMARLIKGDRSYVTDECERKLKGRLVAFPSNETILLDAVEKLKSQVKNIIKDKIK
ncbi:MAG: hypothetical protein IPI45_08555 [Saprospiraceae bacterium]|nr:hypothetical protein [Saprospiraceae bacterium]MBK7737811.1 hypothetical protein [Saprospiraceae bacterium]MBK7913602.1 hypothetical protein [Saprospiraceae bacterium]